MGNGHVVTGVNVAPFHFGVSKPAVRMLPHWGGCDTLNRTGPRIINPACVCLAMTRQNVINYKTIASFPCWCFRNETTVVFVRAVMRYSMRCTGTPTRQR